MSDESKALPECGQLGPDARLANAPYSPGKRIIGIVVDEDKFRYMHEGVAWLRSLLTAAPVSARPFITDKTSSEYVPLCDGHAASWFTERNHLKGGMDAECVACAFDAVSTTGLSELVREVLESCDECAPSDDLGRYFTVTTMTPTERYNHGERLVERVRKLCAAIAPSATGRSP